jgi:hypothetical protein
MRTGISVTGAVPSSDADATPGRLRRDSLPPGYTFMRKSRIWAAVRIERFGTKRLRVAEKMAIESLVCDATALPNPKRILDGQRNNARYSRGDIRRNFLNCRLKLAREA